MTMTPQQVADHLAIERLHYEYAAACDGPERNPDGWAQANLFTEDGTWQTPVGSPARGRAEIAAQMTDVPWEPPSSHFMTNLRIDLGADGETASADALLLNFSRVKPPADSDELRLVTRASRYTTTVRKVGGHWLLSTLKLEFRHGDAVQA